MTGLEQLVFGNVWDLNGRLDSTVKFYKAFLNIDL